MTELRHLQEQMQFFLLQQTSEIQQSIVHTATVSVDTRLAIYGDGYQLRLIECLTTNFPALYAYLGTEEFERLAKAYIAAHPSSFRSIRWFGDLLADFSHNYYPNNPHLTELIDFEWRMGLAFDAADKAIIHVEEMALIPAESWPNLQFTLHPSVQRVNYVWNAVSLWQALTDDLDLPDLQHTEEATAWVLWRTPTYLLKFYSLSVEEAWALDALARGVGFAELCEGLCQWIRAEEVGMKAATYLKNWIQHGMLAALTY